MTCPKSATTSPAVAAPSSSWCGASCGPCSRSAEARRHLEGHARAAARQGGREGAAPVCLRNAPHEREAKPEPRPVPLRAARPVEGLEGPLFVPRRKARPGVLHLEADAPL